MTKKDNITTIFPLVDATDGKMRLIWGRRNFAALPSTPLPREFLTPIEVSDWSCKEAVNEAAALLFSKFERLLDHLGLPEQVSERELVTLSRIVFSGLTRDLLSSFAPSKSAVGPVQNSSRVCS